MKYEKSCGALVYRFEQGELMLLLLRHRHGGHWSFPKGHVEGDETEIETALREVMEETSATITLQDGFRHIVSYSPKPGVEKEVVYFLGETQSAEVVRQEEEISELKWENWENAYAAVTFENDRRLLQYAKKHLTTKE